MTNGDGLLHVLVCGSINCYECGMLMPLKDCLTQWMLMVHEWQHIKMVKCAGYGHDPMGIDGTPEGSLSIPCHPCPHADINLPMQWHDALPRTQWVFLNDSQHTFLTYSQLAVYSLFIQGCKFQVEGTSPFQHCQGPCSWTRVGNICEK